MEVDIVGEDPVTRAIIERLIADFRKDIVIKNRLPARGGQIEAFAPKYNLMNNKIILLTDLDTYDCPPSLIKAWFKDSEIRNGYLFRVAHEEAESWLMADSKGLASFIGVSIDVIPKPQSTGKVGSRVDEIICPIKPSLYLMTDIVPKSNNSDIKEALTPKEGAKKGPGYNTILLPFIEKKWNPANAANNSYSLRKTIQRIKEFN